MTLGMPTLLELPDIRSCARLSAELGLAFVELNMNLPAYQPGVMDEDGIRRACRDFGIYCTLHLDENLNPCDFNPAVREAYVHTALRAIELAARHDMPLLNMHLHPGVYFSLPQGRVYLFEQYRQEYLDALRAFRDRCEAAIGGTGVRICVENCAGFTPWMLEGIAHLLESPVFGLTLDVGHSHGSKEADRPFILGRADRLWHMHLHDADGPCAHLPLGEGRVDIAESLRIAKRKGCRAVVEVKTVDGLKGSMERLHDYL